MKKRKSQLALAVIATVALTGFGGLAAETGTNAAPAPQTAPPDDKFVTREEYEKLKKEFEELKARLNGMQGQTATNDAQTYQSLDYVNQRVEEVQAEAKQSRPGFHQVMVAGDASVGFTSQEGSKSTFGAGIAPLILWQLSDRLLLEAGFDIGVDNGGAGGSGETAFDLKIAELSYIVNDYVTLGAGLFVVPFGVYHNHFDPPWINQLPDDPLPFGDNGIAPGSAIGVFGAGAVPIGSTVLNYDVYVSNGPRLITDDPSTAGSLTFDNYDDNNDGRTFGGRIGFRPIPQLEFGYSMQYGQVGVGSYRDVDAFLQCVDAGYRGDFNWLRGQLDFRAELVLSQVDRATYGVTASPTFGPLNFRNNREGGYVQLAYRPWMVQTPLVRKLQLVGRYDWLNTPLDAPSGDREDRWTVGLNYWLQPNVVLKIAYEFDQEKVSPDANALLLQLGIGL